MKLTEVLSPEYQRRYAKAMRDWEAGRNLAEAAPVVYGIRSQKALMALVKLREEELASKRKKGTRLNISGLGQLTHDGERFVCRKKTLFYLKSSVIVEVPMALAESESVGLVWTRFCGRERSLLREVESALARYYRKIWLRPNLTGGSTLPSLKRNAGIWETLGKPEIAFARHSGEVAISLFWSPGWEEEHGVCVSLSADARIVSVGESGE